MPCCNLIPDDDFDPDDYSPGDDPNAPLESDLQDGGEGYDDEGDVVPCPGCGSEVYEETQKCPHCGDWITPSVALNRKNPIWIIAAILALLAMIVLSI